MKAVVTQPHCGLRPKSSESWKKRVSTSTQALGPPPVSTRVDGRGSAPLRPAVQTATALAAGGAFASVLAAPTYPPLSSKHVLTSVTRRCCGLLLVPPAPGLESALAPGSPVLLPEGGVCV